MDRSIISKICQEVNTTLWNDYYAKNGWREISARLKRVDPGAMETWEFMAWLRYSAPARSCIEWRRVRNDAILVLMARKENVDKIMRGLMPKDDGSDDAFEAFKALEPFTAPRHPIAETPLSLAQSGSHKPQDPDHSDETSSS